jgi:hypothetical protein
MIRLEIPEPTIISAHEVRRLHWQDVVELTSTCFYRDLRVEHSTGTFTLRVFASTREVLDAEQFDFDGPG